MAYSAAIATLFFAAEFISAQSGLTVPGFITAGSGFSIETSGGGNGTLYVVGPEQVLKKDVQFGGSVRFAPGTLYNAGHYVVFASNGANASFDVVPEQKPAQVSFLARPSRLAVGLQNGITGAVYIFDSYQNLITEPTPISFQLATPGGATQDRSVPTKYGAAWVAMASSAKEGPAHFIARAGDVAATRIIDQVPGDPCGLRMSAKPSGQKVLLETDPVKDCSGNAVPDGTIVTFTETHQGKTSTADVPLKRGVAKVEMPAYPGATISVASGVVMGNEIRWGK